MNPPIPRRAFIGTALFAALAARGRGQNPADPPPVRTITRGPKFHWFGYYDKFQFDPTNRYVLGNQVGFEHRSPAADDVIRVGMVDLLDGDKWTALGESRAWNWQQGCMLQWVPGTPDTVMWNDRGDGGFVCHLLEVGSGRKRTIPHPVYTLSPDGRTGLAPDFRRLNDTRPGYGYAGLPDPKKEAPAPDDAGIWKIDIATGKSRLLISFAEIAAIPLDGGASFPAGAKHWFNHLLISPDGSRFIFLHRWAGAADPMKFHTRMFTAALADGGDRYILDPGGFSSHFIWRDHAHVSIFTKHPSHGDRFYLFKDKTREVEVIGPEVMTTNGHQSYLPGTRGEWMLNDTYPDRQNRQHPYLYQVSSGRRIALGAFDSRPPYRGEWRCDLHPRSSRDGAWVCIDSPHSGHGRQMHLIDIRGLT